MANLKDCSICCDKYNLSTRKEVICPFTDCNFSNCKTCVRTYLLGTTADPHCMNCKKPWDQKFIIANLNRAFCDKEYKTHRKDLLVEREISKLPETMHLAERQKKINVEEQKAKTIHEKILKLNKELNTLKSNRTQSYNTIYRIKHGTDSVNDEKRKFIMACPNNDCRGYLSTQYKCELCELFTCPQCLELIGYNKTEQHTCNPDSILSAETIRKETKACPSCGVRIFKINGCSQIWCTECKVAFDYTTGKIDTGTVHNPHYYQHMRQQNNGQAPRNPGDIVCGGLCNVHQLQYLIYSKLKIIITHQVDYNILTSYISNIHRSISHITYHDLPRIREYVRQYQNFEDLRISYILGTKDKKEMGTQIYKRDTLRKKYTELLHLYELLNVVGIESFNILIHPAGMNGIDKNKFDTLVNQRILIMDNLRDYCNKEFIKISVTYNHKVMFINDLWIIENKKYRISDIK